MFTLSRARTWCALVLSLSLSGLTHAAYTQLISFGDSLSDRGNVSLATGSVIAPYDAGQFSNGTVWTGLLADQLGVTSTASLIPGGTNYAWGGARSCDIAGCGTGAPVPNTQDQVTQYIDSVGINNADPDALYTVWTGGNDINGAIQALLGNNTGASYENAAASVQQTVQALVDNGAQHILVNNLPNLALVPGVTELNSGVASFFAGSYTADFNARLVTALNGVVGGNIMLLDAFTLTSDIIADVTANDDPLTNGWGLSNVTERCFVEDNVTPADPLDEITGGSGTICSNPDEYLFFDKLHPTAAGHELIASAAYAAVIPVPAALPLMLSALMGLGLIKRVRKA